LEKEEEQGWVLSFLPLRQLLRNRVYGTIPHAGPLPQRGLDPFERIPESRSRGWTTWWSKIESIQLEYFRIKTLKFVRIYDKGV
jgi:hypothetical protein